MKALIVGCGDSGFSGTVEQGAVTVFLSVMPVMERDKAIGINGAAAGLIWIFVLFMMCLQFIDVRRCS